MQKVTYSVVRWHPGVADPRYVNVGVLAALAPTELFLVFGRDKDIPHVPWIGEMPTTKQILDTLARNIAKDPPATIDHATGTIRQLEVNTPEFFAWLRSAYVYGQLEISPSNVLPLPSTVDPELVMHLLVMHFIQMQQDNPHVSVQRGRRFPGSMARMQLPEAPSQPPRLPAVV